MHGCTARRDKATIKERRPNGVATLLNYPPVLDRQAAATLMAGALLLAISFFTNVGYGALLHIRATTLDEQIGLSLHAAALAALFGDAQLATRLRDRARNEAVERVKQATRRRIAVIRFQLADTTISRLQLNAALAELLVEAKSTQENS